LVRVIVPLVGAPDQIKREGQMVVGNMELVALLNALFINLTDGCVGAAL